MRSDEKKNAGMHKSACMCVRFSPHVSNLTYSDLGKLPAIRGRHEVITAKISFLNVIRFALMRSNATTFDYYLTGRHWALQKTSPGMIQLAALAAVSRAAAAAFCVNH